MMYSEKTKLVVPKAIWFAVLVMILFGGIKVVDAQKTEHYDSPLYSPRKYDPNRPQGSNGLPKALEEIGIEQKLNSQVPLNAKFKDADRNDVTLEKYFKKDRPVILALVYYECPMLCNEVLNGLTGTLKGISFNAGEEFDVVAISFDANEHKNENLAKNKKTGYMERYNRPGTSDGWHFLTGTDEEIRKVTESVGFSFKWDEKSEQFAHAGGIILLTPEGKVSRYFYGIDYSPKDVKLGLVESSENKIGGAVEALYLYCFHYNPATGTYGLAILNVLRAAAVATLLGIGAMMFVFWRRSKKGETAGYSS